MGWQRIDLRCLRRSFAASPLSQSLVPARGYRGSLCFARSPRPGPFTLCGSSPCVPLPGRGRRQSRKPLSPSILLALRNQTLDPAFSEKTSGRSAARRLNETRSCNHKTYSRYSARYLTPRMIISPDRSVSGTRCQEQDENRSCRLGSLDSGTPKLRMAYKMFMLVSCPAP